MSETIPVLEYRMNQRRGRTMLVILASIAIVFGAIAIAGLILSASELRRQFLSPVGGGPNKILIHAMINDGLTILQLVAMVGGAIAFLLRSRHVAAFLSACLCVSVCSTVLSPVLYAWLLNFGAGSGYGGILWAILAGLGGIGRAIFDLVMLLLLQVREVKQVILAFTEVREQSF